MSEHLKRKNPRRPYVITAAGIRRIVLGQMGDEAGIVAAGAAPVHQAQEKPVRLQRVPNRFLMAVAHSDRGMLDDQARQAIAAAALLADAETAVIAVVLGDLSENLATLGADLALVAPACDFTRFAPEEELACLADLLETYQPTHVFMPDNALGDGDLGRRLAARSGCSVATHVVELNQQEVAAYQQGGAMLGRQQLPGLILLAPDTVDTRLPFLGKGEQRLIDVPLLRQDRYQDRGMESLDASQVALEEADFIVSAGNGVTDVPTLEALAQAFGAAVGASRVAVDDGKFTRDKQVGATGKTVRASAYMAIGISGAVQHLQGIKDCKHVIAINLDASAPITKRADLSVIEDAQSIMRELLAQVGQGRSERVKEGA